MNFLRDLILPSRITKSNCLFSGIDSPDANFIGRNNKGFNNNYPYSVNYSFNSRGFRDTEWPMMLSELKNSIWCVGDSFTVGIGSPINHTWPNVLMQKTGYRTINISMDGASNEWISRRAMQIRKEINPTNIIIMWSYLHRRESADTSKTDEDRRLWNTKCSSEDDFQNFKNCVLPLTNIKGIQHYIIPLANQYEHLLLTWDDVADPSWPKQPMSIKELSELPEKIVKELIKHRVYNKLYKAIETNEPLKSFCSEYNIKSVKQLDRARDEHHFDLLTSEFVVNEMLQQLVFC
jgi:hypothetical protein